MLWRPAKGEPLPFDRRRPGRARAAARGVTLRHLLTDPITDDHEGVRAALEGANVLALAATGDAAILRRPIRPHWAMTAAPRSRGPRRQ